MNFHVNFVLWSVLVVTKQCLTENERECVKRRLGACKILRPKSPIFGKDFHCLPDGFVLKTSMEINLLENIHSFENHKVVEKKRPVRYTLDNAALVTIHIIMDNDSTIAIFLGHKYYRAAGLLYRHLEFNETQDNRFTPTLPTFPYILHLEITTNGTFSILADGNTEPFFNYQIKDTTGPFHVDQIFFSTNDNNDDLIAFVDCSDKPNCGIPGVDKLYGCREWVGDRGRIENFIGFRKAYGKDVVFDEFIVVDTEYSAKIEFDLEGSYLKIDFRVNSTEATFYNSEMGMEKSVRTEQWFQVPASPYAVRVSITSDGEQNYVLKIKDLQDREILSLKLCGMSGDIPLKLIDFYGPKLYFDCFTLNDSADNITISERTRKTVEDETKSDIQYHKDGYNYTKDYLDTRYFVGEPYVMYQNEFEKSTYDWCSDEYQPNIRISLEGIIERSNAILHSDLQELNAQNNATADTVLTELKKVNAAVLTELKKLNVQINTTADTNAAVLNELKVISDALTTHLRQNATTVNNSNK